MTHTRGLPTNLIDPVLHEATNDVHEKYNKVETDEKAFRLKEELKTLPYA
jgi:hypothetical protein